MNNVTKVVLKPLQRSKYKKPFRMQYTQNGSKKTWDMLAVHDGVQVLLYNPKKGTLIFVKQFRPAVYIGSVPSEHRQDGEIDVKKYPPKLGITMELCGGLIDKGMGAKETAKQEILEECGYDVPLENLQLISRHRSAVDFLGGFQSAFYCEIDDSMKVTNGGGIDDEIIEVVELTIPEVKEFISQNLISTPPSFLYVIYWFLRRVKK